MLGVKRFNSYSGFENVKLKPTLSELDLDSQRFLDAWTPG